MTLATLREAAATLARAALEQSMTETARVMRRSQAEDTQGGAIDVYTLAFTSACAISRYQARPVERESQPRVQDVSYWMLTFPTSTAAILSTDRVVIGDRTFEVVDASTHTHELTRQAICLEIT